MSKFLQMKIKQKKIDDEKLLIQDAKGKGLDFKTLNIDIQQDIMENASAQLFMDLDSILERGNPGSEDSQDEITQEEEP